MNPASKKYPHLSVAVAQERYEMVEWMMDHLDYTEEECANLSLKEMRRIRDKVESEQDP